MLGALLTQIKSCVDGLGSSGFFSVVFAKFGLLIKGSVVHVVVAGTQPHTQMRELYYALLERGQGTWGIKADMESGMERTTT